MAIPPIGGLIGAAGPAGAPGAAGTAPFQAPTLAPTGGQPSAADQAEGTGFADRIAGALASVQQQQHVADGLAQQAATGSLTDVHDYMIASTQAQLGTELTVAVRNRALESFQQIMNLQV